MKLLAVTLIATVVLSGIGLLVNLQQAGHKMPARLWQYPNAGMIIPLSHNARVTVTSGKGVKNITDDNTDTFWQSDAPFPDNYLTRNEQNLLLNSANSNNCTLTGSAAPQSATDGNPETGVKIVNNTENARFTLQLRQPQQLLLAGVKAGFSGSLQLMAITQSGKTTVLHRFEQQENYVLIRFPVQETAAIKALSLISPQPFTLYELAALNSLPAEFAVLDLGKQQSIGVIETRHWVTNPAAVVKTDLLLSTDGVKWVQAAALNPAAMGKTTTVLNPAATARYLKLQHTISNTNWAKAEIWEITVYDHDGPFGAMPPPKPQQHTMRQLLGVNGIWGWGHNQCSSNLPPGKGPQLFAKVASCARNYHNLDWDVTDPDHPPQFNLMSLGKGTEAQPWLNWDTEYAAWKTAGIPAQVSVQFTNASHPEGVWSKPYTAAYNYGYAFARHFGPTHGNGLVNALEIGNEPWDYTPGFYHTVLSGMAHGAKDADAALKVLPCALQAHRPNTPESRVNNYIETMLTPDTAPFIDALNVHAYSYLYNEQGTRTATYPEHSCSEMRSVLCMLRFGKANLPGIPIQLTEWGWDSSSSAEDCVHSECVTENEQALYAVRGALMAARMGLDRLYWFFYANGTGASSVFNRSGLTESVQAGGTPKQAFSAMAALMHLLGNTRFCNVVQETTNGYIYAMCNPNGQVTHLVAWLPLAGNNPGTASVAFNCLQKPVSAWAINGLTASGYTREPLPTFENGKITVTLSAQPLVIELHL